MTQNSVDRFAHGQCFSGIRLWSWSTKRWTVTDAVTILDVKKKRKYGHWLKECPEKSTKRFVIDCKRDWQKRKTDEGDLKDWVSLKLTPSNSDVLDNAFD